MRNLMRADLWCLVRRPLTWIVLLCALGSGFIGGYDLEGFGMDNDYLFYVYVLITVSIVWPIGKKQEERVFVNEITAGHTRVCVVLSQTFFYGAFAAAVMLIFSLGCAMGGARYLSQLPAAALLSIGLGLIFSCTFYAMLITVIACLVPSRATAAVICFAVFLALLGGAYEIHHFLKLDQWQEPTGLRALCKPVCTALDVGTPFGQIEYHREHLAYYMDAHHTLDTARLESLQRGSWLSLILAAAEAALVTLCGAWAFCRKDMI